MNGIWMILGLLFFWIGPAVAVAGSANLRWDPAPAPTSSSGCSITAYQIEYGVATGTYTGKSRTSSGTATTLTVNGLDEGKTYFFSARTVGSCNGTEVLSGFSNEVSGAIAIGKPANLKLSLAPAQATFPVAKVGQRLQKTLSIENRGDQKIVVYPHVSNGPFFNTQGGQGIPAGGVGRFVVYFEPAEPGFHEGRMELRLADGSDSVSYPLTGYAAR